MNEDKPWITGAALELMLRSTARRGDIPTAGVFHVGDEVLLRRDFYSKEQHAVGLHRFLRLLDPPVGVLVEQPLSSGPALRVQIKGTDIIRWYLWHEVIGWRRP